jgi:hypothetical protein
VRLLLEDESDATGVAEELSTGDDVLLGVMVEAVVLLLLLLDGKMIRV